MLNRASILAARISFKMLTEQLLRLHPLINFTRLIKAPLVITGQGLGGYLAILFTLLYQNAVDIEESNGSKTAKRPICITFGAPLLGDEALGRAISERRQWKSCFVNVVAITDPLASSFSSNTLYKPFGTFMFCTNSGGHTTFEDQVPVLAVLDAMASSNAGNSQMHDYTNELRLIRKNILYRGVSELSGFNLNPLRAGIASQFQEIGLLDDTSDHIIAETEEKRLKIIKKKRKDNAYQPMKKLNEMKISLTYMEWHMKMQRMEGGYYDSYKNTASIIQIKKKQEVIKHQRILNQYWKKMVEEKNLMPQKEGAKLRKRWLYSGTNYRRIIEPLDIADYYKRGKTDYIGNRPKHYELLEKWSEDDKKGQKPNDGKMKAACLTEDSCFWAHVEEALILLNELKNGGSSRVDLLHATLEQFEVDLLVAIKDFAVSPDVFLEGSSLMKWWRDYKAYKGSSYVSELICSIHE
ncbi:hypothetical protein L2E82_19510 [Cichorium intybus]|uniref:Uncharacterized protein n=1 Tax=Cichorium intybus TaxID=13427 RepID=A0ACB9FCU0_CICIN|nr:hypothetical protein L2E82_19510 [Cichorium intybus]